MNSKKNSSLFSRIKNIFRRFSWQKLKRFLQMQISSRKQSTLNIALSAGFGAFMSILPTWGYQILLSVTLAHFMKLNKFIVFLGTNISIPPTIPIILYISYITGGLFVDNPTTVSVDVISFEFVKNNFFQYIIGCIVFAVVLGIVTTLLIWWIVATKRKYRSSKKVIEDDTSVELR